MRVTARHTYTHPVETTFTAFTDPDLVMRRLTEAGATGVKLLQHTLLGDRAVIKTERVVTAEIPRALQRIAGSTNTLVQTENWTRQPDGSRRCALTIEVKGVPVTLRGTMQLTAAGSGSVNDVSIDIDSSIPLLGGQLVKFTAASTEQSLAGEQRAIQAMLA